MDKHQILHHFSTVAAVAADDFEADADDTAAVRGFDTAIGPDGGVVAADVMEGDTGAIWTMTTTRRVRHHAP